MKKVLTWSVDNHVEVTNEKISGFVLDVTALQANGTDAAPINDLNLIGLSVSLKRANNVEVFICNGYLDNLLTNLYGQTPRYDLVKQRFESGHKFYIDFRPYVLDLRKGDVLTISVNPRNTAFTSLSAVNSPITIETVPSTGQQTIFPIFKEYSIGNGEAELDRDLGDNVRKVTIATDFTTDYSQSTKAKIDTAFLKAVNYEKNVSNNLLEAENIHMLSNNPDSPMRQTVLFASNDQLLRGVNLKAKFTKAVDNAARVLVTHMSHI